MAKGWMVVALLGLALPASAEPLQAVNARDVRVTLGKLQKALGVDETPEKDGWRLQLRAPADGVAEVFDVTPGTPAITFSLRLVAGLISFDISRFAGGHTYHVAIRGKSGTSAGLVYLYPDAVAAKQARRNATTRVKFEEHDAPAGDGEIAVQKKGSL
jgi:hypothetical protein